MTMVFLLIVVHLLWLITYRNLLFVVQQDIYFGHDDAENPWETFIVD